MRFLLVIDNLQAGGAQRQLVYLAQGLIKLGHQVDIFTYAPGDQYVAMLPESDDLRIISHHKKSKFDFSPIRKIGKHVKQESIDTVIAFLFTPSFYALVSKALFSKKTTVIVSERSFTKKNRHADFVRWWYRFASGITANSMHQTDYLKTRFSPYQNKIQYIPNAIDQSAFHYQEKTPEQCVKIVCIGRVQPIKGTLLVIKALHHLISQGINANVSWIGANDQMIHNQVDPYFYECQTLLEELNLTTHWTWAGRRPDIINILHESDLFLHASHGEGFPNVLLEAMSAGCLAIASDIGDHRSIISQGVSGFLFDVHNLEDLNNTLIKAITCDAEKRHEITQCALEQIKTYTVERLAKNYLALSDKA